MVWLPKFNEDSTMKKLFDKPNECVQSEVISDETKINKPLTEEEQAYVNKKWEELSASVNQNLSPKKLITFSASKGKLVFNITGTPLEPNRLAMVGKGKFIDRYKQQLENYLFTDGEINPDNLIPFIMLMEAGEGNVKTIRIVTSQNKALIKDIVIALNNFFEEHRNIIKGMYQMFKGSSAIQQVQGDV